MPWTKQFDVDEALDRALALFWRKGYEATSMRDLLAAMGIQKGSFYNTFSSKHELLLRALDRYTSSRFDDFSRVIDGLEPREAIAALFRTVAKHCVADERELGCMVVNCALELAPDDPEVQAMVHRTIRAHEGLFADLIRRGQDTGEIPAAVPVNRTAKALMGLTMAMRVYSRAGAPKATIAALSDQAMALVEGESAATS